MLTFVNAFKGMAAGNLVAALGLTEIMTLAKDGADDISFFEIAMDFRSTTLLASDQVWQIKEVFTSISLIAALAMLVPITKLLYQIPFFKRGLDQPRIDTTKRDLASKLNLIIVFIITATFAALTYLPSAKLTLTLFPEASRSVNTWFFPQRMTNAVMVWAVISGLFALIAWLVNR
jgi:hypothetical protein